jgi:hypothetical protein
VRNAVITTTLLVALLAGGCGSNDDKRRPAQGGLPQGGEPIKLDPANFTTRIDNPYWPMVPGSRWVYRETENGRRQRIEVNVTRATKRIAGVTARVVHDVASANGHVVEDTYDWYAQDKAGNVWYLGEDTTAYRNGKPVSRAGSWQAGVDGAQAGVILPARPRAGLTYRQEYYAGHAEDAARVLSIDEQVQAPFGHFTGALLTKDYTPLEPKLVEYKLYARRVGLVLDVTVSGGAERQELVRYHDAGR